MSSITILKVQRLNIPKKIVVSRDINNMPTTYNIYISKFNIKEKDFILTTITDRRRVNYILLYRYNDTSSFYLYSPLIEELLRNNLYDIEDISNNLKLESIDNVFILTITFINRTYTTTETTVINIIKDE